MPASIKYTPKPSYGSTNLNTSPYNNHYQYPNEAKVYSKLQQLDRAMNEASMKSEGKSARHSNTGRTGSTSMNSSDIDRLEQMMTINKQQAGDEDPEMQQLNGLMERIFGHTTP